MANNDPAADGDWTKTPPTGYREFDNMLFEEIDNDDLLWLTASGGDSNHVHRKLDDNTALDLKTQTTVPIGQRTVVYQKT